MMGHKGLLLAEDQALAKRIVSKPTNELEELLDYSSFRSSFDEGDGIIMMAIRDIFRQITLEHEKKFLVSCSFLEIYNDVVHDLLTTTDRLGDELPIVEINVGFAHPRTSSSLKVREMSWSSASPTSWRRSRREKSTDSTPRLT